MKRSLQAKPTTALRLALPVGFSININLNPGVAAQAGEAARHTLWASGGSGIINYIKVLTARTCFTFRLWAQYSITLRTVHVYASTAIWRI